MAYPKRKIYLVNFDPTIGHEVKKKRPAFEDKKILEKVDRIIREHLTKYTNLYII